MSQDVVHHRSAPFALTMMEPPSFPDLIDMALYSVVHQGNDFLSLWRQRRAQFANYRDFFGTLSDYFPQVSQDFTLLEGFCF